MYRLYIYSESKNGFVKNRILKVEYGKYHVNLNESLDQSDPVNDLTLFRGVSDHPILGECNYDVEIRIIKPV